MMPSSQKSLLVIGKNGQLACSIAKISVEFSDLHITYSDRSELDLSELESIDNYFSQNYYDIIVNVAAYTAVEQAESEPELADLINHRAVTKLAEIALYQDSILIHISTDYVFDGTSSTPYKEEDPVNPINVYGKTKLLGEQAILQISPKGCIVRTSWLYSEFGNNFVKTMLRLGREQNELNVVCDQIGSPTYAVDLARVILIISQSGTLASKRTPPIYHYANNGVCSWYDLAKTIFDYADIACKIIPITSDQCEGVVKRPHYSVLNQSLIDQEFNLGVLYWKDSLKECLNGM